MECFHPDFVVKLQHERTEVLPALSPNPPLSSLPPTPKQSTMSNTMLSANQTVSFQNQLKNQIHTSLYKKAASILEDLILKEGHSKKCGNELSMPIPT